MGDGIHPPVERVEVVAPQGFDVGWEPRVGAEALDLLRQLEDLDDVGRSRVRDEGVSVLRSCLAPAPPDAAETGLVVGHVQSGKTMSFTAVAALARDNAYPLVIVITGTSIPLSEQSLERLKRDLRLASRSDRQWQHFHNPRRQQHLHAIEAALVDWRDPDVPEAERQTVLITVMKNHSHLRHVGDLLRSLRLEGLPALVIDDEADQAGLNNLVAQGGESTTYRRLLELRRLLPHHTYLQYTATPQAPLLINLIDVLSPSFAEVLTPGTDYIGGREFFIERPELVRVIPAGEIPTRNNMLSDAPQSLLEAMRLFILGVAAGLHQDSGRGNRSMMVHPSQHTLQHAEYWRWVRAAQAHWEHLLQLDEADTDRLDFIEELQAAYADLAATAPDLPEFATLLGVLRRAIRRVRVTEVNAVSGHTPQIDWNSAYGHILVGGQAMDRGFTVRGLTVTYMPRGVGVGSADTIQQRARFFGYKRPYFGYCRIYLDSAVATAYRRYVEHEEDIRGRLIAHRTTGRPLLDWKRGAS